MSSRETTTAGEYPVQQETDIALRDGSTAHVRPVRPDDQAAVRAFLDRLSPESIGFRFFGAPDLGWASRWSVDVDYCDRLALIATTGLPSEVIAHAAYVRTGPDRAEVAFMVADAWQGHGIATALLAHLASFAQVHGMTTFTADVLPHNHRMIEVFRESGFPVAMRSEPDAIAIELPTSLSDAAIARFEERERIAAVAAVRSFLEPSAVAVIGASRRPGTVGGAILANLRDGGYTGTLYAVNDRADAVGSLRAYHSVTEISAPVDLAVIVVPAARVLEVARDCAAAGVRALVVISAGFAESGVEGARLQAELVELCRSTGMRIVGPNCLGLLNTARDVSLNATFAPTPALPGHVGFLSQSGGVGIALIEAARRLGVGLSSFVSVGNKADLSGNDFLQYWEHDEHTDVALLYLESFGNPRKFARIAPRFARRKPIVAVKSGRSSAGMRGASSHTGALVSASDVTIDALFEQAGVIRVDTLKELFDVAALLAKQPVPGGDRVAIVTNAGGPGIMCADACQAHGVQVPEPPAEVRAALAELLPPAASLRNPIDMLATAPAAHYRATIETLARSGAYDAIIALFVPPLVTRAPEVAEAIRLASAGADGVTVAAAFMTSEGIPEELAPGASALPGATTVPGYEFPEDAATAVALAARHGRWRGRPQGQRILLADARTTEAAAIIARRLAAGGGWLEPGEVDGLLRCYGLPLVRSRIVAGGGADAAVAAAGVLGWPVAVKAVAEGLVHKSDAGGVLLGIGDEADLRDGITAMDERLARAGHRRTGLLLQEMAPAGVELIVGVVNDASFGPVLACGAGGTAAELIRDVAVRLTPVTRRDVAEMLRGLKTFQLLDGYRGAPRADVGAVEDVLGRVSAMVETHREIAELDLNPLVASPSGALILDARIRIEPAVPLAPMPSLSA